MLAGDARCWFKPSRAAVPEGRRLIPRAVFRPAAFRHRAGYAEAPSDGPRWDALSDECESLLSEG